MVTFLPIVWEQNTKNLYLKSLNLAWTQILFCFFCVQLPCWLSMLTWLLLFTIMSYFLFHSVTDFSKRFFFCLPEKLKPTRCTLCYASLQEAHKTNLLTYTFEHDLFGRMLFFLLRVTSHQETCYWLLLSSCICVVGCLAVCFIKNFQLYFVVNCVKRLWSSKHEFIYCLKRHKDHWSNFSALV